MYGRIFNAAKFQPTMPVFPMNSFGWAFKAKTCYLNKYLFGFSPRLISFNSVGRYDKFLDGFFDFYSPNHFYYLLISGDLYNRYIGHIINCIIRTYNAKHFKWSLVKISSLVPEILKFKFPPPLILQFSKMY